MLPIANFTHSSVLLTSCGRISVASGTEALFEPDYGLVGGRRVPMARPDAQKSTEGKISIGIEIGLSC